MVFDLHAKIFICIMPIVLNFYQLNICSVMLYELFPVMTLSISFSNTTEIDG